MSFAYGAATGIVVLAVLIFAADYMKYLDLKSGDRVDQIDDDAKSFTSKVREFFKRW